MTTGANTLGMTSWIHTKTWTLGSHYEKKENQYEMNHTELIYNRSKWTISNQQHKYG